MFARHLSVCVSFGIIHKWRHTILGKNKPSPPFVMFHHPALDTPNMTSQTFNCPLFAVCSVAYMSFKQNTIFCMIWHICNSEYGISQLQYVEMISWILSLSSTTPRPGFSTYVCDVMQPFTALAPPTWRIITISWTPLFPRHLTSFMDDPFSDWLAVVTNLSCCIVFHCSRMYHCVIILCVCMCILSGTTVPKMTYTVSGGTLNLTHSLSLCHLVAPPTTCLFCCLFLFISCLTSSEFGANNSNCTVHLAAKWKVQCFIRLITLCASSNVAAISGSFLLRY